uniref:G-protein coupled receptor 84 n=1 Tax=Myxine glutinosa TaxID=7769 RepID=UPI00358DDC37
MDAAANNSYSCYDDSIASYRYFGALLGILVTLSGTIGNVLTLFVIITNAKLRTRINLFILNLTLSDLLYCTFLQPFTADAYLHLTWRFGALGCKLFGLFLFISNSVSILNLGLIAVSRYLVIRNKAAFEKRCTTVRLWAFLLFIWLVGLASFAPLWYSYDFQQQVCTCSFDRIKGRPYTTILLFLYFGLGLSSIGICYFLIYRKLRASAKALASHKRPEESMAVATAHLPGPSSNAGPRDGSDKDGAEFSAESVEEGHVETSVIEDSSTDEMSGSTTSTSGLGVGSKAEGAKGDIVKRMFRKMATNKMATKKVDVDTDSRKVTRMCFAVFLVFVICYLPFCLLNIVDAKGRAPQVVHMMAANLTWLNSCINPILYALMNRHFREAYGRLLRYPLSLCR